MRLAIVLCLAWWLAAMCAGFVTVAMLSPLTGAASDALNTISRTLEHAQ